MPTLPLRLFPKRCVALLLALAAILCCSAPLRAAGKLPEGTKVLKDLAYVTDGHARQKLDLFIPAKPKGPILVWIHGGGWVSGSKADVDPAGLLGLGYTVASIGYRYSTEAVFPAQIQDCKAAVRYLKAHAKEHGYNADRLGVMGASAGGHLVALLCTTAGEKEFDVGEHLDQSSAVRCGIDFFGPTDFLDWKPPTPLPAVQPTGKESLLVKLIGGTAEEKKDLAKRASPVHWVTKEAAPMLIYHGTADALVGPEQSQRLADKLKAAGVPVTVDIIKDAGHGGAEFFTPERITQMVQFVNKYLMEPEAK